MIRKIFSKCGRYAQKALSLVLLAAILLTNFYFFPKPEIALGATYTWTQSDWSGGTDGGAYPNHSNQVVNGTPWTKYASASSSLNIGASITLATTSGSWTDNTFATSPGGGTASTTVSGGAVTLARLDSRPADISTTTATGLTSSNCGTLSGGVWNSGTGRCDWTPQNNSLISGKYFNVGAFTVANGTTVNITSTSTPFESGMTGQWKLDGGTSGSIPNGTTTGLADSSGNGNNGTSSNANGTGMAWTTGPTQISGNGGAVSFDGTDDYINIKHASGLPIYSTSSDYSISMWVKGSTTTQSAVFSGGTNNAASANCTAFSFGRSGDSAGRFYASMRADDNCASPVNVPLNTTSTLTVFDNTWHHIVWVDTGTPASRTPKLYVDGVLDGKFNGASTTYNVSTSTVTLGNTTIGAMFRVYNTYPSGNLGYLFNGSIDEVRTYNRALSQTEVQNLYYFNNYVGGLLEVHADSVNIAGTLNGDAKGYAGGLGGNKSGRAGQGGINGGTAGTNSESWGDGGGGGGGYGSAGGAGGMSGANQAGGSGGAVPASSTLSGTDIDMGSGGGGGGAGTALVSDGVAGGSGGAAIYLFTSGTTTVSGTINANGGSGGTGGTAGTSNSCSYVAGGGGGGAAGGGILLSGNSIAVSGTFNANGGTGGSGGGPDVDEFGTPCNWGINGDSGGGGRIKLFGNITNTNANFNATGSNATTTQCSSTSSLCNVGAIYSQTPTYPATGTFTSQIKNISGQSWGTTTWTDTLPSNTSIALKVRSCDDASCGSSGGVDESVTKPWSSCNFIAKEAALSTGACVSNGDPYIQYQATASTTDTTITPTLSAVTINYNSYPSYQLLTSSPYNTTDSTNILSSIQWTEVLATGTDILFQARTAPTSTGPWTGWQGPDGTSASYFTDASGAEAMPSGFGDGSSDEWFQYQLTASTSGAYTPTLSDVTVVYVINAPPQFEAAPTVSFSTSTQSAQISYSVKDSDTDSGSPGNQYKVWPSFEYSTSGGASWTAVSTSTLLAADYATQTVATNTYNTHTATWDAQTQLGFDTNTTTAKIKVTVDDHEAANNTVFSSSTNFNLDTRPLSNINASQTQSEATAGKVNVGFDYFVSQGAKASSTISLKYYNGASWLNATSVTGNTGQGVASGTAKQIVWNAKADYPNVYTASMRVRVVAAHYNGTSQELESSNFILDTKNPASSLTFDAGVAGSASSAVITITPSDDSSSSYKISDDPTTQTGTTTTGWVSINTTSTINWTFDSDIEAKSLLVQYRDVYFNTTTEATITTTPPVVSTSFLIQDVSKTATQEWRLYAGWGASTSSNFASYKLEYATSTDNSEFSGYSNAAVITGSSTNYYVHTGLNTNWYYRYRIGVTDTNGNTSVRSTASYMGITAKPDGVQNFGEGGGGAVATAPKVENVTASQGADKNVTVNYLLTDSSTSTKTNVSYEGYLFYSLGITLPANASSSGNLILSDSSKLASTGYVQVNNEVIKYSGNTTSTNTLTGLTRGTWPDYASAGRTTRQNSTFFEGTPVWVMASSTTPISITNSTISSGQSGTTTWNTYYETALAGNTFSSLPLRILVHDNQSADAGPLSSQNDYSENGVLASLDLSAPTIQFTAATSSSSEASTSASFTLVLARAYPLNASVNYAVTGTANGGGTDYTLSAGTATITAGSTSTNITATIVNDSLKESSETIIITLSSPTNSSLGTNTTHTYTITDDDSVPTIQFATTTGSGSESATSASFQIVLSEASGQNATVDYTVAASSTATGSGTDYTLSAGTATITAGSTSTNITAVVVNDSLAETNETIVIALSNASNANLGPNTAYSYTITDDDALPTIQFATTTGSGSESATSASFQVVLASASGQNATVTYAVSVASSTATGSGTDYTLSAGTATITAGSTSTNITATITDDSTGESDETIVIALSDANNTTLGANTAYTYTILDDDNSAPEFSATGTAASQVATSSDPNFGRVEIRYSVRDSNTSSGLITPSFEYNVGFGWNSVASTSLDSGALSSKAVATGTFNTYTAYWNAGLDAAGVYTASAQVRITANDGAIRNNTASATSTFLLDAKNPVAGFSIDAGQNIVTLTTTEDSNFNYVISNNSYLTADGSNAISGNWQPGSAPSLTASTTWVFASATYPTVYYRVRDIYNNAISTSTVRAPSQPANFSLRDVSNVQLGQYREFLAWDPYVATTSAAFTRYELYRSTDGGANYSLLASTTDVNTNNYTDTGLSTSTTYYYKVRTIDGDSDVSAYSSAVNDAPDGQGGTDVTAPTISSTTAAEVQSSWAKITWTTDELSNSIVEYGLTNTNYNMTASSTAYVTSHEITLSGLTSGFSSGTTYYFRVKSSDISNNQAVNDNSGLGYSFTTAVGPAISGVATESADDRSASITWNTNIAANSYVIWATSTTALATNASGSVFQTGSPTLVSESPYQHRVTLSGLTAGRTYYYYVQSTDGSSNTVNDKNVQNNVVSYYSFNTTYDTKPPVISNIQTPVRTSSSIVITWQTDELADGQIEYGTVSGTYSSSTALDSTLSIYHIATVAGLLAETTYYYRITSADAQDNSTSSTEQTAQTTSPLQTVTVTVVSGGGGGSVGVAQDIYDKLKSDYEKLNQEYWQINKEYEKFKDTTPPAISNIKVSDVDAFSATITWQTDEPADSFVDHGETTDYGFNAGIPEFRQEHIITLRRLKMGTKYHFTVSSQDKLGNIASSSDQTFTTLFASEALEGMVKIGDVEQFQQKLGEFMESVTPSLVPPVIADIKAEDVSENGAAITWRTNVKSSSIVALAQEEQYNSAATGTPYAIEIGSSEEREINHKVKLTNLIPDTLYNFQVKSQNNVGAVGQSKNFTFTTKSLPVRPRAIDITKNSLKVVWKTEKPASSIVDYKNLTTAEVLRKVDEQKVADHFIFLENLTPDTQYELKVSGADERGNLIESGLIRVRTSKDVTPPLISSIKIDSTLVPGRTDRVQTIVRWLTNEPSNSVVYYEEGSGGSDVLANKIEAQDMFVIEHAIIIPVMKPGTLYRIKIASVDEANNQAQTPARTIITPQYAQSIIDVVVKNFQDTFKFLDKLK